MNIKLDKGDVLGSPKTAELCSKFLGRGRTLRKAKFYDVKRSQKQAF